MNNCKQLCLGIISYDDETGQVPRNIVFGTQKSWWRQLADNGNIPGPADAVYRGQRGWKCLPAPGRPHSTAACIGLVSICHPFCVLSLKITLTFF